ncbi:MAG TPA: FAD-dependent oxidoreductase, partial [Candidatus Sumerlaeota bacterium]|nr:FAD-dependent oxidoreductase [Candidatus Sumerlaeota bacterium]
FPGGTATASLVTPLMRSHIPGNPSPSVVSSEITARALDEGYAAKGPDGNDSWFDPTGLSFVLDDMLHESGVVVLYNTFFSAPIVSDGVLKGVIIENKGGRQAIMAARVIDATGDADVAFAAGCPIESGRPGTSVNQPTSLRFEMGAIRTDRFVDFLKGLGVRDDLDFPFFHTAMVWNRNWPLESVFRKAVQAGDLEEHDGHYFQAFGVPGKPGFIAFNCPEIAPAVDVTRPDYQSAAFMEGRKALRRLARFMKKYFPGFENACISQAACLLGVRESRRIIGEYYLTGRDILDYTKFEDAVARSNYPVDIHGALDEYENYQRPALPLEDRFFEAPYRCLVPRGVDNLLVTGRCVSADFVAQSTLRIQPTCRALGEAAAIAAHLSLGDGVSPRALDGRRVRAELKAGGAFL